MIKENLNFEKLINYNGNKNHIYEIYDKFTSIELKECLIVETRGIGAFKYNNVITSIITYSRNYLKNNKPNKVYYKSGLYPIEEYEFSIPSELLNNLTFVKDTQINIIIKNILIDDKFKVSDLFGNGTASHSNFDKIINDNGVDKLETIDIEINGYAINGELEHKTLLMPLYHELNHAIENYERLKKYYKGETSEKGLYDKLEKIKSDSRSATYKGIIIVEIQQKTRNKIVMLPLGMRKKIW